MNKLGWMIFSLMIVPVLSACSSDPEWLELYEECKAAVESETAKITAAQSDDSANESAQMRAMRESMNKMAVSMAMGACEMIKTSCENDPDGTTCQAYIEQSKKQK